MGSLLHIQGKRRPTHQRKRNMQTRRWLVFYRQSTRANSPEKAKNKTMQFNRESRKADIPDQEKDENETMGQHG